MGVARACSTGVSPVAGVWTFGGCRLFGKKKLRGVLDSSEYHLYRSFMQQLRIIQGRAVTDEDVSMVRDLIRAHPDWNRTRVSRELCDLWSWTDETGRRKDMACRTLLLKLERRGLLELPRRQHSGVNHRRGLSFQPVLHETAAIVGPLRELLPVRLVPAESGPEREMWQTLLQTYHYLGFTTKVGKSLAYLATDRAERPVACLLFGAAAWKTASRDRFVGWNAVQRAANLHKVVNNMRFLIPPWVRVPHLASHVLGLALRQLPGDWQRRYGHEVYLVETFVDLSRFQGTCYRAANWLCVGQTTGRSRNDVHNRLRVPVKAVYVRPLCRDFRARLIDEV